MKKENFQRGITLIALVVTIIVLIILAGVSINMLVGENGIINMAQRAAQETEQAKQNEEKGLQELEGYIDSSLGGETATTVAEARGGMRYNNTTSVTDDIGNTVYIPGGFKVAKDSGTKVEEGIVITDGINEFVWIPVGNYNTTDSEETIKTNNLTRRTFTEGNAIEVNGDDVINSYYYGEGNENSIAKDQIEEFLESSKPISEGGHGGFYIGRYEAGTEQERTSENDKLTPVLVQANKNAYVYVTRDQAKIQSEALYSSNEFVTSGLISSYAWDTALNFICQNSEEGYILATTTDNTHGNINTNKKELTGAYMADNYCKIHDLIGNCVEWTTEYCSYSYDGNEFACVRRGGYYSKNTCYGALRSSLIENTSYADYSFRVQLYMK